MDKALSELCSSTESRVIIPDFYQRYKLPAYSELVYGSFHSRTVSTATSEKIRRKVTLGLSPVERHIAVAAGNSGIFFGINMSNTAHFRFIVIQFEFLVILTVPYDFIIGGTNLG